MKQFEPYECIEELNFQFQITTSVILLPFIVFSNALCIHYVNGIFGLLAATHKFLRYKENIYWYGRRCEVEIPSKYYCWQCHQSQMWHNFDVITFHSFVHYNHNSSTFSICFVHWPTKKKKKREKFHPKMILNWKFYEPFNIIQIESNKVILIDLENLLEFMWSVIAVKDCACIQQHLYL